MQAMPGITASAMPRCGELSFSPKLRISRLLRENPGGETCKNGAHAKPRYAPGNFRTLIFVCIYIYIHMALDPFAAYILAKIFKNFHSFIVKNGPEKMDLQKRAKNAFFVGLNSSTFPTEKGKMRCFS